MQHPVVLLGPQRPDPNVRQALDALDVDGRLLAFTAGWRHDEAEVAALEAHVGRPVEVVPLYAWFDEAAVHAADVARAYRARQERIRQFKQLYRIRMRASLSVVRALWSKLRAEPEIVAPELDRATLDVRRIDQQCVEAIDQLRVETAILASRFEVPWVAERVAELRERVAGAGAVLIAGGHVAVLRNRMLFFAAEHALQERLGEGRPVLAWGAGSMVVTERIVLFYDDPPEGPSEAEVLDRGLGFVSDVTVFPHARERLRLDQSDRVAALARRFGPGDCLGLENGAWLQRGPDGWHNRGRPGAALHLRPDGVVADLPEAP